MKQKLISNQYEFELNKRINGELTAENMYNDLANSMQYIGYFGAQKFFLSEAKQERKHYQKLVDIANDLGCLPVIEQTYRSSAVETLQDAFTTARNAEYKLYVEYSALYNEVEEKEPIFAEALLFFLNEQRKSVGEYNDFLSRLELCGNDACALLVFDNELKSK